MRKTRIELLLVFVTMLALVAGVAAGVLSSRLPAFTSAPAPTPPKSGSSLVNELGLSTEQAEKMRFIWEGVQKDVQGNYDDARRLQKKREDAMFALLSEDGKKQFEKMSQEFALEFESITKKRDEAFKKAVEETKKLLNDDQKAKYEGILKTKVKPDGQAADPIRDAMPELG